MIRWKLLVLATVMLLACLPGHVHAGRPQLWSSSSSSPSTAQPVAAASNSTARMVHNQTGTPVNTTKPRAESQPTASTHDSIPHAVRRADAAVHSGTPDVYLRLQGEPGVCSRILHTHQQASQAAASSSGLPSLQQPGASAVHSLLGSLHQPQAGDPSSASSTTAHVAAAAGNRLPHSLRHLGAAAHSSTPGTTHRMAAAAAAHSNIPHGLPRTAAAARSSVSPTAHGLAAAVRSIVRRILRRVDAGAPEVGKDRFDEDIDPSITNQVSARWGNMKRPPARQGLTGEDAEATSGATFPGVHRHAATHTVFATANAQSNNELPQKKSTVKTRARSAMDRPGREYPNIASGAASMPALGVGNLVLAQTFEGATATSLSDSMALPSKTDPDKGQAVSWNMITSKPLREYKAATATASWATTAQPVKSMALTGPANYRFALAQAGDAVSMSQIERSSDDALPKNLRRQWQDDKDRRLRR